MDFDRVMSKLNPLVVGILESRFHGLASKGLLVLHITGRRSGKQYKIPVGYQRIGDGLQILVSKATRKQWWRNYSEESALEVTLRGEKLAARGQLLDKDSPAFESLALNTLIKIPALIKQFELELTADQMKAQGLNDQQWQQLKHNAEAVAISLVDS